MEGDELCDAVDYECIAEYKDKVFKMYFVLFCLLLALCLLVLAWCVRQVIRRGIEQRVIANEALQSIEESRINLKKSIKSASISSKPDVQIPLRKLNSKLQRF